MKGLLYLGIGGSLITALGSIIYSATVSHKSKKVAERLNLAIDNLSDNIDVDISQEVVREATEKAVDKAVDAEVKKAITWVSDDVNRRIKTDVKAAIDKVYPEVSDGVKDRLERSLDDVDISKIKDEVVEKAAKIAAKKFDSELQSVMDNYNSQIKNLSDIYIKSIANSVTKNDLTGSTRLSLYDLL